MVRRANRATALVEVSIGKDPNSTTRTGTAFCVDRSGIFVTLADVVKGVTETRGQVRMLFGDRLEPRTVVYPKIVHIDDETNLASLQIDPAPELSLAALGPARSPELSAGLAVVALGFPAGRHYPNHDAKGQLIDGPRFDFTYSHPFGNEPPDHLITPLEVGNVWREKGGASSFDVRPQGEFDRFSSGAPALNAAGEVVGIIINPDPPASVTITVERSQQGVVVRSDAPAPFKGALSAVHLSRFLEGARGQGDVAGSKREAERFAAIARSKKATALVEVSARAGECSGTAFCVDRSGLFITNAHVVEDTQSDSRYVVKLVMDSGLPTQRAIRAEVVRVDRKIDLALLKTEAEPHFEALELGKDGDVAPTTQVTTFGFPLGKHIASGDNSYPEVATNVSRITALGDEVRFDGQLNPGNSGGPVVDSRGTVIGVAHATILGASINFAIPVGQLRTFLATPGLRVRTMPVALADRGRPTRWTIDVVPSRFARLPENMEVSVTLRDGLNSPRKLWAEKFPGADAGAYRLEFAPMPRDPGRGVALAIRFGNRTERAIVEDRQVRIGDRTVPLGAIRHLVMGPKPWAFVTYEPDVKGPIADMGEVVRGSIAGLGRVNALQERKPKPIDLGAASEFTVVEVEPKKDREVVALIEVHKGGKGGSVVFGSQARMQFAEARAPEGESQTKRPLLPASRSASRVPDTEGALKFLTRTMPLNRSTAILRLEDKENLFQLGGELDVTGVPRGSAQAIRPPRGPIGKALTLEASQEAIGTRALAVAAPPVQARPQFPMARRDSETRIFSIVFSQDGSRLALGLHEAIRVYEVASGRMFKELEQPNASQLAFAADRDKLLAFSDAYRDFSIGMPQRPGMPAYERQRGPVIWDLKAGLSSPVPPIPGIDQRVPVEWISPDSPFVLTRGTGIKCWDVRSGEMRLALEDDWHRPLAIKTGVGGRLVNPVMTADGKRLLSFYGKRPEASPKAPNAAAPPRAGSAPDDPYVPASVRLHEIETGRLLFETDFTGMTFVGLVPGSDTCVSEAADGSISSRDLRNGRELRRVTLRPSTPLRNASPLVAVQVRPEQPQLTPDGKQLVEPMVGGGFALFDLASGAEVARFKPSETSATGLLQRLVMAPTGRTAAVYFQRDVHLWTLPSSTSTSTSTPSDATAKTREPPVVRKLAGTATAVAVGGAGRYLLITLAKARQLAVFDVNAADVVKIIPLASEKALVAAGATRFVIAYPETNRIERWDLGTLLHDGDPQAVPVQGRLEAIALGADSEGPLLVSWWFSQANPNVKFNRLSFVDIASFKVLAVGLIAAHGRVNDPARLAASGGDFEVLHGHWTAKARIRASYDGSLFGISVADEANATAEVALKAEAGAVTLSHDFSARGRFDTPIYYMIPSPDGRRVFHGNTGIRDAVFLETPPPVLFGPPPIVERELRFPTTDARFDFSLRAADTIAILRAQDGTRLFSVAGLDEMTGVLQPNAIVKDGISLENRYHVVPAANLLVTIPPPNNRLVLRRLEIQPAAGRLEAGSNKTAGPGL
jgi:S1-C subfamily serine protease